MNYPDNVNPKDKSCPWNQVNPEMTEWEPYTKTSSECVCCGELAILDEDSTCEECFVPEEIDHEGSAEDDAYDRWKDDMLCGD